ncbi:OmpA family protein [Polaribacter sp. Z014]|uniref:OmpA family protein n=1 Tax=Polaribacter sp. Z014 TaxID=2927126 RepID=UPI0020224005|nr:OmpA family protein [Polaribacter sp. Z014]MCL7764345.1 OmpA family protein [Polaribacter sp. Z014]
MKTAKRKISTKVLFKLLLTLCMLIAIPQGSNAQFFKKLKEKASKKIKQEAEKRSERRMNKKIEKEFDQAEDVIDGKTKKNDKEVDAKKANNKKNDETNVDADQENSTATKKLNVVWSKFDFVPGDTVIFEDSPSTKEENGEFPSRWDLYKGSAEIGEVDGEPVIIFLEGGGSIVPYIKKSDEDYLPEIFTIEFDVWFEKKYSTACRYYIHFEDQKNQWNKGLNQYLTVTPTGLQFAKTNKRYPGTENLNWCVEPIGKWRHISIAYTKGEFKAYMDDTRLINIPHLEGNPWGFTIKGETNKMYLKNIRIAKGGVKYYDRVLSEGKIIVNGIKFDTNKATLKAESMGPINKIYQLMEKNTDLKFSVEGHTDSDGGVEANMTLSKARGKSVMDKLVSMGIAASRLKYNGFGESKPIDNNSTPEGKANNRRVEFVKF